MLPLLAKTMALLIALPISAFAHPHEWIELKITAIFDEEGKITALRQNWLMDEFFSSYATEDIERVDGLPPQKKITALGEEMLGNIKDISYFSNLEHKGAIVKPSGATHIATSYENLKLRMIFDMKLAQPVTVDEAPLIYRIYDPEFYIEMIHIDEENPLSLQGQPDDCKWAITPPNENQSLMAYANSLGANDKPNQELGSFFAETAAIGCGDARQLLNNATLAAKAIEENLHSAPSSSNEKQSSIFSRIRDFFVE